MKPIFVFGSNLAGRHGKGAALHAKTYYNAEYGVGKGRTGNAYAIPTKDERLRTLALWEIEIYIQEFFEYALHHPDLQFTLTRVGCGLAGYRNEDMVPLFENCPSNCTLPKEWSKLINKKKTMV